MPRRRILIVEDSPTMRQLLVFALKRLKDTEIVEASDGMDGLRKVTSDHFDLALVDINMPVMDGLKLISLIRSEDSLKEMPIVVITTEGATEDRERALALGAIAIYRLLAQKDGFSALDHELFTLLAGHAATAIFAARLHSLSERKLNTIQGFIDLLTK